MKTIKVEFILEVPKDFTRFAEYLDGSKEWFLNGLLHRENDLPAVELSDGTKFWYLNHKLHRETGPAVEYSDGTKQWWYLGELCADFEEVKQKHYHRICNPNN